MSGFIIKTSIAICVILSLGMLFLFSWEQYYSIDSTIATDIVGQYGDFIGGVVGTILSIVLLYFTFKSQINESKNNANIFIQQQHNDTFFHLLNQYNSIIDKLAIVENDDIPINMHGKEVIHYYVTQIQNEFGTDSTNKGRKLAVDFYLNFYSLHKDFIPIYFRTIYRIFDLIESSKINEEEKVKYAKIIRSQLTDSELILIRYNAMTTLGKNMRYYIVKYNLLKHMPMLSLFEHNILKSLFTINLENKANIILYNIKKNIHNLNNDVPTLAYTSSKAKYNINVSRINNGQEIKLDFNRHRNIFIAPYDDFYCFETITLNNIQLLLEEWMKEIFVFSKFNLKDYSNSVNFTTIVDPLIEGKEHFCIRIKSKNNIEIKI